MSLGVSGDVGYSDGTDKFEFNHVGVSVSLSASHSLFSLPRRHIGIIRRIEDIVEDGGRADPGLGRRQFKFRLLAAHDRPIAGRILAFCGLSNRRSHAVVSASGRVKSSRRRFA